MGDDITIGVTEIVNNIEVTAQPNDQIVDISVIDNTDEVTLNITPTVIEINVNKGSSFAKWGTILGTLSDQEDLQDALDLKADLVDGKVPSSQLPSYVDDVIEVANYAALPVTGESGKIYITIDNNHIFRWTGSIYVEITDNTAVWGAITGTLSSQTDLVNSLNLRVPYTGATGDVNLGTYDIKAQKYWMLDEVNSNYGSMHFTDGNYHIEDADGHKLFVIEDGFMQLHKTDTIQSNLYTSNLTAVRDHYLPDASGTLALTSELHNAVTIGTANGLSLSTQVLSLGLASSSANGALSSTDWTTFNNKQNALTNPITGTGTTNYLPKFTGSTALGNSLIYDNGTNIGIGTASPSYKLDVAGVGRFLGSIPLTLERSGSTKYTFSLGASDDFYINNVNIGSTPLTILSSGNIGIGTTSPSTRLEVTSGNAASAELQRWSYNAGNANFSLRLKQDVSDGLVKHIFDVVNNGTTYSNNLVLTNGNVGIGTTSPSFQLQLSNDSAAKPGSPLWTVSSDIRIKENVRPYTDGLEKLMQVNPVYYDYNGKAGFSITKDNVGIIAQEMQEVLPNTIKTFKAKLNDDDDEETELLSFNANEIIYVLINSVKELKAEIELLKQK
jgi:hypothetical protein